MLYASVQQGRAVLRLVLEHLHSSQARQLSSSAARIARAGEEAHHQQILHDRRQRREIQEDVVKLSSRGEIDRRHAGPKLPVVGSAGKNLEVGWSRSIWKTSKEGIDAGKGVRKRYEDRRVSQAGKRGMRPGSTGSTAPSVREQWKSKESTVNARTAPRRQLHSSLSALERRSWAEGKARRLAWAQRTEQMQHKNGNRKSASASAWQSAIKEDAEDEAEPESIASEDSDIGDEAEAPEPETPTPLPEKAAPLQQILRGTLSADDVNIEDVEPLRPMKVAKLATFFSRTLFSPGVHHMQDQRTGVWNFPVNYQHIPQPSEFAFDRTPGYVTPSEDEELAILAKREDCRFIGSTSTLTKALSHMYFAISGGKGVNLSSFTQEFASERTAYTAGAEQPAALIVTRGEDGVVSVDSDKSFDVENVLSDFGRILEKVLTTSTQEFQQFLTRNPETEETKAQKAEKEAYKYRKSGSLLMRSQLDCHDPRLPGSGVFDLKTRAVYPIRHDRANYAANGAYYISNHLGLKESFEKELYDLMRAGMLKFSMQVRIGGMDGIFLAYHNTKILLGFQYLPLDDIDRMLFGSPEMGESSFHLSVGLLEKVLQQIMEDHPHDRLEVVLRNVGRGRVLIFVTPASRNGSGSGSGGERKTTMYSLQVRSTLNGHEVNGPIDWPAESEAVPEWKVTYTLSRSSSDPASSAEAATGLSRAIKYITGMNTLAVPDGKSVEDMKERDKARAAEARSVSPLSSPLLSNTSSSSSTLLNTPTPSSADADAKRDRSESPGSPGTAGPPEKVARIRWKDPDERVRKLRQEALASGKAYEKRKVGWKNHRNSCAWIPLRKDE